MKDTSNNIIIYTTADGKAAVSLVTRDGKVWMNQKQLAELFDTSKQNIGKHILNILNDKELEELSVVKNYFTTAQDCKLYVRFYDRRRKAEAINADNQDLIELQALESKIKEKQ